MLTVSPRDNGVKAIENLMKKKGKFDYILLETTGLADPGMCCEIWLARPLPWDTTCLETPYISDNMTYILT